MYPTWHATQTFLRDVQKSTVPQQEKEITFQNVASVVEEVGERYGRWQDKECRTLKNDLVAMEHRGTGRVRLADFYGSALKHGNWQFSESIDYLRQLGALDESDPSNLRVIIPNYVNSPSNCVASSNYYHVCCIDECEDILGHLEEKLGAPEATPTEIAELVAALPSATVPGNRTLSRSLLQKLDDVAQFHSGRIPLHGRLFAQWMHNVYPRECSYPHLSGTTKPRQAEVFMAESGKEGAATLEEMRAHIESSARKQNDAGTAADADTAEAAEGQCGTWTLEEELIIGRSQEHDLPSARRTSSPLMTALRGAASVAAIVSVIVALSQTVGSAMK